MEAHSLTDKPKRQYRDKNSAKARGIDSTFLRIWAKEQGLVTATVGKIKSSVIDQYVQEMSQR